MSNSPFVTEILGLQLYSITWPLVLLGLLFLPLIVKWQTRFNGKLTIPNKAWDGQTQEKSSGNASYPPVEALPNFRWEQTPALRLRPFKAKYNISMAINKCSASELIEMDKNYLSRVTLRKQLLNDNPNLCIGASDEAKEAIAEFYSWMIGTYLPSRFPLMFKVTSDGALFNVAVNELVPIAPPDSPFESLCILARTVEEDISFLLPSADGDGYTLHATAVCFPNGFNLPGMIGRKLCEIHVPVPSYKERLSKSMDRTFDKMEVGTFIKRANWSVSTSPDLFIMSGSHGYSGDDESPREIDPDKTFLRCERQTLHRLPRTKAMLLMVKTYFTPIREIKAEGSANAMIEAIDGLKAGNAPGIHFYKKAGVWGDSVKRYLSELK